MDDNTQNTHLLAIRYMQGVCTEEERTRFHAWLQESPENEIQFFQMKEIFDTRNRIPERESARATGKRPIGAGKNRRRLHVSQAMRYAAIVAVLFGGAFIFYLTGKKSQPDAPVYVKQMVVHNTRGVYQLVLPDGSRVWLHGGTTLVYPERFSDSLRTVDLQGEAYFAVQADTDHPFVVQTPTAKVRATGTEFNITAYPKDKVTTTTLVKGIVDVRPNNLAKAVQLKSGQQASVTVSDVRIGANPENKPDAAVKKDMPVVVQDINPELFADWKDGIYRFKNEPFRNIALRLEKMYGVEIRIESNDLQKAFFSGMFTTDYSLKEVFEIIDISNPVAYRMENKIVFIKNRK